MKKICFFFALSTVFYCCNTKDSTGVVAMEKQRSWDEVVEIASRYGLADTFRNKMATENGLMYFSEEGLKLHFQKTKQYFDINYEYKCFAKESKNILCVSDYFRLVDAMPLFQIRRYESEENYEKLKREYIGSKYKFFIQDNQHVPSLMVVTRPEEMPVDAGRPISNR